MFKQTTQPESRGDEREGQGERKTNESEETEEIKHSPSTFTCCKESRPCLTVSQYQVHDTFASPNRPTGHVYSVFRTPIRKFTLDLEVFFFLDNAKVLNQQ